MVDEQRSRYLGGDQGAPPVPPPGGYHGARRTAAAPAVPAGAETVQIDVPKTKSNALGWVALVASILFALILFGAMIGGGADPVYSVTVMVLQLIVAGLIIAALLTTRGRMLGAISLAIALLFNMATVGAVGAVVASATGSYDGVKSEAQKHEEAYPGVKGTSRGEVLSQPSLEQVQANGDELMTEIRARLTDEFGYSWKQSGQPTTRHERNGYGGESMLQQYTSEQWTTVEPVRDNDRKREIAAVIDEVLAERDMYALYPLNSSESGISSEMVAKLYGSADIEEQHTWEWYSDAFPDPLMLYVDAFDPSKDPTGAAQADREAKHQATGEPVEGVQLTIIARELLSEKDRAEFEQRMGEYPGF
ncbi:hypothetical protein DY023_06360 [Microbacterium bovistercoris]|uniref:Sox C-terminal domain-containing protein n=1 Tax=Microbacterium bovistercoris TaxID=2293570 RepID=A0A371NV65_9MICO|nr:TIGR04086 family membrane protein [Microbacterium bovistercoris]REJ06397.1 hypothetical protein DY023_06360 [Microbacterium bovistercoris]